MAVGARRGAEWFGAFRAKGWRLAEDEVPEVAALLRYKGESKVKDVAEVCGVSQPTIRAKIREAGEKENSFTFPTPTQAQRREDTREAICDMPEASNREIAREVGVDHKTVAAVKRGMEAEAAECDPKPFSYPSATQGTVIVFRRLDLI